MSDRMVGNTTVNATGVRDIPLKSIGNEKLQFSLCLTAKAYGTKMKPFADFQSAKNKR